MSRLRTIRSGRQRRLAWILVGALGATTAVLGFVGWGAYHGNREPHLTWIFDTIELFKGGSGGSATGPLPPALEAARFVAPLVVASTVIVAAFAVFRTQIQARRARVARNHVVVCGAGERGRRITRALHGEGRRVTLIERDGTQPFVAEAREMGIPVLVGDASSATQLRRANVAQAGELICVVGGDGTSVEVATALGDVMQDAGLPRRRGGPAGVRAFVGIDDPHLCRRLQATTTGNRSVLRIEWFNLAISAAEDLLDHACRLPVNGEVPLAPRLAVVGLTPLGMAIAIQAVRRWRALRPAGSDERLTLLLVDAHADTRADSISTWVPDLESICDLRSVSICVDSPEFERCDFIEEVSPTTLFVCHADESTAAQAALVLGERARGRADVVLCTRTDRGLACLFPEMRAEPGPTPGHAGPTYYPVLDRVCTPQQVLLDMRERLARILHLGYVFHAASTGGLPPDDPSLRPWDELDVSTRESNREAVDELTAVLEETVELTVLTSATDTSQVFTAAERERLAAAEHERYRRFKLDEMARLPQGRDAKGRTAADFAPWAEASESDRRKTYDQIDRIPGMLAYAGFGLQRRDGTRAAAASLTAGEAP